jgi:hypothetical protein
MHSSVEPRCSPSPLRRGCQNNEFVAWAFGEDHHRLTAVSEIAIASRSSAAAPEPSLASIGREAVVRFRHHDRAARVEIWRRASPTCLACSR